MSKINEINLFESVHYKHKVGSNKFKIINILKLLKQKLIFGKYSSFIYPHYKSMAFNSDKFIKSYVKNHFIYNDQKLRVKSLNLKKWKPDNIKNINYIFYDQPLVGTRVALENYNSFINKLQKISLNLGLKEKFAIKLHPNNKKNISLYDGFTILDTNLPSIFFDEGVHAHISISSNSIVCNKLGINISLVMLIKFLDRDTQKYLEKKMRNSEYEIMLPKNFSDLEEILRVNMQLNGAI
jgi:hypothetical protein